MQELNTQRIAVSVLFFTNGFVHANWASRLPELQSFLQISNTQLGTMLFTMAVGALFAMPLTGWMTHQYGSSSITRYAGILLCIMSSTLAWQSDLILEGFIFFLLGFANGAMDVAMNEQAVLVERNFKKPIMSSFHAFWSIGMAIGAGSGALFSKFEVPLSLHIISIAIVGLIFILWASTRLIATILPDGPKGFGLIIPSRLIVPLGLIAFCGMLGEGTLVDWSAIYMNKVVGETEAMSALAFGSFGASMMVGRLIGDQLTQKLGKKKLLILDSILAIAGLSLAISVVTPAAVLMGFFISGLGLSTVVPLVYTTAGNTQGVTPGVGIAMATTIGYSGFFVGPPTIGYMADVLGLQTAFLFSLGILTIMFVLILSQRFEKYG